MSSGLLVSQFTALADCKNSALQATVKSVIASRGRQHLITGEKEKLAVGFFIGDNSGFRTTISPKS
jgi:hypothetical protein